MAESVVPIGRLADIGVIIPIAEVVVGDVIIFGIPNDFARNEIVDIDRVVKVDGQGVHFGYGGYLIPAENPEVYIIPREVAA